MTSAAVIATVLGYIAVLFAVAWVSGRRADNAGFFSGNRRTPWYMAAFAMIGAAMSGVTFISVPGSVAVDGFSYMQMVAGFTVGQLIVAFVLIPTFYRLKVVSLYEYLDDRFGVRSHRTGAWFFFVSKMLGAALRIYVVCAVMQLLVFSHYGLPFWLNAAVTMLFVWLYTQQGGVKSLIWTDTLKTVSRAVDRLHHAGAGHVPARNDPRGRRVALFEDVFLRRPGFGPLFLEDVCGGHRAADRHDGTRSGHDAAQPELRHAARLAEKYRPHGRQPDFRDLPVPRAGRAALHLHGPQRAGDARKGRSGLFAGRSQRRIAGIRWHTVRYRTYFKHLFSRRIGPYGPHDFVYGRYP